MLYNWYLLYVTHYFNQTPHTSGILCRVDQIIFLWIWKYIYIYIIRTIWLPLTNFVDTPQVQATRPFHGTCCFIYFWNWCSKTCHVILIILVNRVFYFFLFYYYYYYFLHNNFDFWQYHNFITRIVFFFLPYYELIY